MSSHNPRELKNDFASEHDFIIRRHSNLWLQMGGLLIVAFGALFLASARMNHTQNIATWEYTSVLVAVLGILGAVGYIQVQRHRDLLLLTEFQNALFTSTARLNFRFCLITKRDGSIVYYDPGFQNMFPEVFQTNHSTLDELFSRKYLPTSIGEEISRLMQDEKRGVLLLPYASEGKDVSLVVHVDPLAKPRGYVAIRGREYVERRSSGLSHDADNNTIETQAAAPAATSNGLQSALLANLPTPTYAVDTQGKLIFANPSLERELGYAQNELSSSQPALSSLIYQASGATGPQPGTGNFEGEAVFLHRSGGLARFHVHETSWTNAQGQRVGSYGFLLPNTPAA